jgi:hypothetical protein
VFTFGAKAENNGMPNATVLHNVPGWLHPGFIPLFMPKLAPKIVIVTASLKGDDGRGLLTVLSVPSIELITGAEY